MKKKTLSLLLIATAILLATLLPLAQCLAESKLERPIIKMGVAGPLKKSAGVAILRGAEMASDEINDSGGVLGAKLQLVSADTEGTAPKAIEAIEKLYYADKVDVIVGAYTSEEATAFQQESAKLQMNLLYHGTTHMLDKNYEGDPAKYKYSWTYTPSDLDGANYVFNHQYDLFVKALKTQLGLSKLNVAVISDMALWTEGIHSKSQEYVKARPDCALAYVGRTARDATDFTAELTELRKNNVQLIIFTTAFSAGYSFVKQAYDLQIPAMITGTNLLSWSIDDFVKAVGVNAAAYNSSHCFTTLPTTPHTGALIRKYTSRYGGSPLVDVGLCYNGVKAYAKAVETAGSLEQSRVQKALESLRLPESEAWGCKEFRFDDKHRIHVSPTDGIIFFTFQFAPAGGANVLDPPQYKTSDVLVPPWVAKQWKKN
jgi:branched-chain amino acid transport system substrate-binding protein